MKQGQLRVFNTLYDHYKFLGLPTDLIDQRTEFTVFNLKDVRDPPSLKSPVCRLNFFVFNFVKNGIGKYIIDEQTYQVEPFTLYITNPGHCRAFEWTQINEVFLVTMSESFLKANVHANIFEEFPFLLSETFPAKILGPEVFGEFEQIYQQIIKEYNGRSLYRSRIIGNLFVVLLLKVKEYFWSDYNPIYEGNRSSLIVKNFKRLLEKHYRELDDGKVEQVFRVQEYAAAQNLHPNYLSSVIKAKTGKPIGTWIAEKTIAEAKSLLQNSAISIKEIAYRLGFSEPAHFSNYFKKHTGSTPLTFRNGQATITHSKSKP